MAADSWYYEAVKYVTDQGIMNGTTPTTFSPMTTTSRAMIVTMLWRMEGSPVVNYRMDFTDVKEDAYYAEAVRWAASEGIVDGYEDGTFGPDKTVTREQMATILYRYAQEKQYDVSGRNDLSAFADAARVSAYAKEAMQWAVDARPDQRDRGQPGAPERRQPRPGGNHAHALCGKCESVTPFRTEQKPPWKDASREVFLVGCVMGSWRFCPPAARAKSLWHRPGTNRWEWQSRCR